MQTSEAEAPTPKKESAKWEIGDTFIIRPPNLSRKRLAIVVGLSDSYVVYATIGTVIKKSAQLLKIDQQLADTVANMLKDLDIEFKTPWLVVDHRLISVMRYSLQKRAVHRRGRMPNDLLDLFTKHIQNHKYSRDKPVYNMGAKECRTYWVFNNLIKDEADSTNRYWSIIHNPEVIIQAPPLPVPPRTPTAEYLESLGMRNIIR